MQDIINFFHEATVRICGSLEIEEVAENCLDYLQNYIPLDGISVHFYNEKSKSLLCLPLRRRFL